MTKLAILWHMHQPYYADRATGEHVLPWVRLHALKDYFGMAALAGEFPNLRLTFNLVPSLLVQLEAFAAERARDRHLDLGMKPVEELSAEDRHFMVANFFSAHRSRMIDPYPRYRELLEKRAGGAAGFSADDLRDLQVWHKLAWVDVSYLEKDPRCIALIRKARGFSDEDKAVLREVELEILNRVIPEFRRAAARGQAELSTSPFYHPILPLLCDSTIYLRMHPQSRMPRRRFAHPEDAREQLERAVSCHERVFGERPRGLWPSEGAVSDAVVELAIDAGFDWMATDEVILARTLGAVWTRDAAGQVDRPDVLYRPYRAGGRNGDLACAFRDHTLSDLIGFTYAGWDSEAAADDFCRRVRSAGHRFAEKSGGGEGTVFVILDGENAWEHYAGGGRPFLRALYQRLSNDPEISTVTMSAACEGATDRLGGLFPGSWIDGNFYIWIGHRDDHRAWDQLAEARGRLDEGSSATGVNLDAREELLIAEGSDWFWWYGDDHSSDQDTVFDELFRLHVRSAYLALGLPVPDELFVSNISTGPAGASWSAPVNLLTPVIDGEPTHYFEWLGAGVLEPQKTIGTMQQASSPTGQEVRAIHFGFDLERFHLRVDLGRTGTEDGLGITVVWLRPSGYRLAVRQRNGGVSSEMTGPMGPVTAHEPVVAFGSVIEVSVPFAALGVGRGDRVALQIALTMNDSELERHPAFQPIEFDVPGPDFNPRHWTA